MWTSVRPPLAACGAALLSQLLCRPPSETQGHGSHSTESPGSDKFTTKLFLWGMKRPWRLKEWEARGRARPSERGRERERDPVWWKDMWPTVTNVLPTYDLLRSGDSESNTRRSSTATSALVDNDLLGKNGFLLFFSSILFSFSLCLFKPQLHKLFIEEDHCSISHLFFFLAQFPNCRLKMNRNEEWWCFCTCSASLAEIKKQKSCFFFYSRSSLRYFIIGH